MNGQMPSFKRYEKSLEKMMQPIMPSQLPKVKMDLAGLSRYAKKKGVSLFELSEDERKRFLQRIKKEVREI